MWDDPKGLFHNICLGNDVFLDVGEAEKEKMSKYEKIAEILKISRTDCCGKNIRTSDVDKNHEASREG